MASNTGTLEQAEMLKQQLVEFKEAEQLETKQITTHFEECNQQDAIRRSQNTDILQMMRTLQESQSERHQRAEQRRAQDAGRNMISSCI